MSDHHLPDNLNDWPTIAHEVLGVDSAAGKKEIRKAYAKLLRCFRPDEEGEKFNRILSARDQLLMQLKWREEDDDPFNSFDSFEGASQQDQGEFEPAAPENHDSGWHPPTEYPKTNVESAWDVACEGDLITAHSQLKQLVNTDPGAALRLYWLERLSPELRGGDQTPPREWLIQNGVRLNPYQVSNLLTQETGASENFLLDDRFRPWLRHLNLAREIIPMRWDYAVRTGKVEVVKQDLDFIFESLLPETSLWCLLACRSFALSSSEVWAPLVSQCFEELKETILDEIWTPYGDGEEVFEQAREVFNRDGRVKAPAIHSIVRKILFSMPSHPVHQKHFLEEKLVSSWTKSNQRNHELMKEYRQFPMSCYRYLRLLNTLVPDVEHRLNAAHRAYAQQLYSASSYDQARNWVADVCKTFLVPLGWLSGRLYPGDVPNSERNKHVFEYDSMCQNDLVLNILSSEWCVYALSDNL